MHLVCILDSLSFWFFNPTWVTACLSQVARLELDNNGKADSELQQAHPSGPNSRAAQITDDAQREQAVIALRKWRQWTEGPYATLVGKGLHKEEIAEWAVQLEEDMVEQEVPDGAVGALCTRAGLQHLEKDEAIAALAVYRVRKNLQPDFLNGTFIEWKDATNAGGEPGEQEGAAREAITTPSPGQGESGVAAFHELVARLAAARVENDALRKILVPQLNEEALNKLLGEHLPYAWMGSLLTGLKSYKEKNEQWFTEELAILIWNTVNEELRAKRQGMKSTNPQNQPQGMQMVPHQQGGAMAGGGTTLHTPPGNCFKCGGPGHWATNCPLATQRRGGRVQMMGQQQVLVSSKGVAFDMAGPPPGQCRVCGGNHWEQYCPHANPQGVPQMFQSATGNAAQPHPQQSFQGASPPPAAEGVPQFPNAQAQQHMQSIYREMGFQVGNQA